MRCIHTPCRPGRSSSLDDSAGVNPLMAAALNGSNGSSTSDSSNPLNGSSNGSSSSPPSGGAASVGSAASGRTRDRKLSDSLQSFNR
jgi:hypothetical protein